MFKFILFFIFTFVLPSLANAHGLEGKVRENSTVVVIVFNYSTGDPAKYVEASVFSPQNSDIEFQTGRTDMLGQVVFAPNAPGQWKIVVEDTQGHKTEQLVQVDEQVPGQVTTGQVTGQVAGQVTGQVAGQGQGFLVTKSLHEQKNGASTKFKIVLGLSLILNISLLALWLFMRNKPRL